MSSTGQEQAAEQPPPVWPEPIVEDFTDPDWPELATSSNEAVEQWVNDNKRILLRTVTWNLCAKQPPPKDVITRTLLPPNKFHLYIIGTEECERSIAQSAINPSKKNWESYLRDALGPRYVPLRSHTLQAIHIIIFVHEGLAHMCTMATSAAIAFGVGNTLGNKGAVGLLLRIGSSKLVVVNAHFAAHQNAVKQRNSEFRRVDRMMPALLSKKESFHTSKRAAISADMASPLSSSSASPTAATTATATATAGFSTPAGGAVMPEFGAGVGAAEQIVGQVEERPAEGSSTSPPAAPADIDADTSPAELHLAHPTALAVTPAVESGEETAPVTGTGTESLPQSATDVMAAAKDLAASGEAAAGATAEETAPTTSSEVAGGATATQADSDDESEEPLSPLAEGGAGLRADSGGGGGGLGSGKGLDQLADAVIFMGDLNYRIRGTRPLVDKLLAAHMHEVMLSNDQLRGSMREGAAFERFVEPPLNFAPTYKFDVGSDVYDTGPKSRIPSWTDRILYVPSSKLHCLAYNSDKGVRTSDHRPVYASFALELGTYVELNDKNDAVLPTRTAVKFTSESQVCSIS